MTRISKYFRFFKKHPIGFLTSLMLSFILIIGSIVIFTAIVLMINTPRIVRDRIAESTGFNISSSEMSINPFTGSLKATNISIENPSPYKSTNFLVANNIQMSLEISSIFSEKIVIKSIDVDIGHLNCIKISAENYNVREFIIGMANVVEFDKNLEKIQIKIRASDYNTMDSSDLNKWSASGKMELVQNNVADYGKFVKDLEKIFDDNNASFISVGIDSALNWIETNKIKNSAENK